MNFEEHVAKTRILLPAGIAVPRGVLCTGAIEAADAARALGPAVVKAQVPTGKRGKAGGIKYADTPEEAEAAAHAILGMQIDEHRVERVLVEQRADIAREHYAAVLPDPAMRQSLLVFSTDGGIDIEDIAAAKPDAIGRLNFAGDVDVDAATLAPLLLRLERGARDAVADVLVRVVAAYRRHDAELIEINPLALLADGRAVALDCKFVLDDGALERQAELASFGAPEILTALERRARDHQLKYVALDGNVGVLANGAGLTMTTMDVIRHMGGAPANFLEIGGDAYTKASAALGIVLANPGLKSLVINFCGAFARTDVMAGGIVSAWKELQPRVPVFFSIHGTGEDEAIALVRRELGIVPFDRMEDAVLAAVRAAQ